jgi:hypothetical protein
MKLLNLDKISPKSNKTIIIAGVEYAVQPLSVGTFIKTTKEAEEYVKKGVADPVYEVQMIVNLAAECIPAAPRIALESLTLEQLQAIATYVQKGDVDGAEDVEGNV